VGWRVLPRMIVCDIEQGTNFVPASIREWQTNGKRKPDLFLA